MRTRSLFPTLAIMFFLFTPSLIKPLYSHAHCDTLDGPVVAERGRHLLKVMLFRCLNLFPLMMRK